MSEYLSPDELIRELLNVLSSAEADLIALRQVDNSGRTTETLGEIYRVKEIVEYNNQFSKAKNIDLFNDRL
jgi:DNA-directed RNA polymerase sigma subunit (sigma70/sigma32)|tara:strand:+ start:72 stop:284 length:213 start_codon:yes stop_codon:yes gene_type:complete